MIRQAFARRLHIWVVMLTLFWSAIIAASLFWNIQQTRTLAMEQAMSGLRSAFFKDLDFRVWASRHGGVYVPVTPETIPDPYLAYFPGRDVVTTTGQKLTLINPALMVRQINDVSERKGGMTRISGLHPINPDNAPDLWEARAIKSFKAGTKEISEVSDIDGAPYLRLIRPMFLGAQCIGCHVQQGFKQGDLSGAISVSVPLGEVNAFISQRVLSLVVGHGMLWLLGLAGIVVGGRQLELRARETERAYAALEESEARAHAILSTSLDAIITCDVAGCVVGWNRQAENMFGWRADEIVGKRLSDTIIPAQFREAHDKGIARASGGGQPAMLGRRVELSGLRKSGEEFPLELALSAITLGGKPAFSAFIRDITEHRQAREQLWHSAHYDALTGVPNRSLLVDRIVQCLKREMRRYDFACAVLFLDLDRFKNVNDSLGHTVGDQILVLLADRLQQCVRPGDTVARLGGDEFAILLDGISGITDALLVAERVHGEMAKPFQIAGHEIFASISIGIVLGESGKNSAEQLLRDADTAMYRAKSQGSGSAVFDQAMHAQAMALMTMETELRAAIKHHELFVNYQPIVSAATGKILGFEALARWGGHGKREISPVEFIPVAEETGMIGELGHWVLLEACHQLREWNGRFPGEPELFISVNMSAKQFLQENLAQKIERIFNGTGVNASHLHLEVTESALIEHPEITNRVLLELKATGTRLYIDDFGTGYSSLSYLHNFPFDALKIDRSFIARMEADEKHVEMVSAIIAIARTFGMEIIAEGVETSEQLEKLKKLGCSHIQGYYFSPPLSAEAAGELLARQVMADPGNCG